MLRAQETSDLDVRTMSDLFVSQHPARPKAGTICRRLVWALGAHVKPTTQKAGQIYGEIDACHMGDRAAAALHSLRASRDRV